MLQHECTGTEHLLLALMAERHGVAARTLADLGIWPPTVRQMIGEITGDGASVPCDASRFTPRIKKVFELALRESLRFGHRYVGTEHLLLGLLREREGVVAQILEMYGVDLGYLRRQVVRELSGTVLATR